MKSVIIHKNMLRRVNDERLKSLNVGKCIECGLCSYVCPSKIAVREYVRKAKEKLRKEGEK